MSKEAPKRHGGAGGESGKSKTLQFRVTPAELEQIKAKAREWSLVHEPASGGRRERFGMSKYLRSRALDDVEILVRNPVQNLRAWRELTLLHNNANQLVRVLHTLSKDPGWTLEQRGELMGSATQAVSFLEQMMPVLQELQSQLRQGELMSEGEREA